MANKLYIRNFLLRKFCFILVYNKNKIKKNNNNMIIDNSYI